MDNDHNFETDTKLFNIRLDDCYFGDVWAADADAALVKAHNIYPDYPKDKFTVQFVGNLYPVAN